MELRCLFLIIPCLNGLMCRESHLLAGKVRRLAIKTFSNHVGALSLSKAKQKQRARPQRERRRGRGPKWCWAGTSRPEPILLLPRALAELHC